MKKQTAVEWLVEQWPILESQIPERILKQAKEMEREHLEEAYQMGREGLTITEFNETFNP